MILRFLQIPLLGSLLVLLMALSLPAQTGHVTHVHDPCIIKCGDYYYIFSTGDRIAMRRSPNLKVWQYIGEVFSAIPAWGRQDIPGVINIWAPDIYYHDGTYYLYYSLSTFGSNRSCIGLATNKTLDPDDATYKWIDLGKVFESTSSSNYNAIDPNIIMDAENNLWMSFGSFWTGIKLLALDPSTWKAPANPRLNSIAGRGGGAIEAPFMVHKNGYYYLFVSFDLCCRGVESTYKIMVGRSSKVTGPFVDRNKRTMLNGGGHLLLQGDDRWKGTGHCAVLLEDDADWLVYHAYDAQNNGTPTLRISQLYWDDEDWPSLDPTASVKGKDSSPHKSFRLYQNHPNPFNSSTHFTFDVARTSHVELTIYDIHGHEVSTLVNDTLPDGHHIIPFDASSLASGAYLYSIRTELQQEIRKMVVLR